MKYGRINQGIPDVKEDIAALKDLLAKNEIDRWEYNKRLSAIQKSQLTYIVKTNGGYTPSKKLMNEYNQLVDSITKAKEKNEAYKKRQQRDEFVKQMTEAFEEKDSQPTE